MIKQVNIVGIVFAVTTLCTVAVKAQSGGDFAIKKGGITSGGGVAADSPNSPFAVYGLIGQPVAGPAARNGAIGVSSGMLSGNVLPTAAGVSVSGRVMTPEGRGLLNAVITITGPDGATRNTMTSGRGNFQFNDVAVGETYVISVRSRRFSFTPQAISITDNLMGIDFVGQL